MINLKGITKSFQNGAESVQILHGIDVTLNQGEFTSIMGPSGSGKSTLMNIIGCLDKPTTGTYELAGQNISNMSETELAHVRNKEIGFVFQNFMLLPRLSALQNVELPLIYAGVDKRKARALISCFNKSRFSRSCYSPAERTIRWTKAACRCCTRNRK